jgi:hypothetical protein
VRFPGTISYVLFHVPFHTLPYDVPKTNASAYAQVLCMTLTVGVATVLEPREEVIIAIIVIIVTGQRKVDTPQAHSPQLAHALLLDRSLAGW